MAIGDRDIDVLAGRSAGLYPASSVRRTPMLTPT
jgi:hypothetical protein